MSASHRKEAERLLRRAHGVQWQTGEAAASMAAAHATLALLDHLTTTNRPPETDEENADG